MKADFEHRKVVYKLARSVLYRRSVTHGEIEYVIELLSKIHSYKSLGLRQRLQNKMDGKSIGWEDL